MELRQGSATQLPFGDAQFTKAFAVNSFQHWSSPAADLSEVRRVLRDDGLLLICLRMALPKKRMLAAPGMTEQDVQAVIELIAQAGFRDIRTERRNVGRDVVAILSRK